MRVFPKFFSCLSIAQLLKQSSALRPIPFLWHFPSPHTGDSVLGQGVPLSWTSPVNKQVGHFHQPNEEIPYIRLCLSLFKKIWAEFKHGQYRTFGDSLSFCGIISIFCSCLLIGQLWLQLFSKLVLKCFSSFYWKSLFKSSLLSFNLQKSQMV